MAARVLGTLRYASTPIEEKFYLTRLIEQGQTADQNRSMWLERQRLLTRLRYGIRQPKVFPWKDASNLSIPLIDHCIRKYKPVLMRLIVEPDPVCEFVGADPAAVEAERTAETIFNWLLKTEMEAIEPLAYVIDCICHRGFAFVQVGWEYLTEWETRIIPARELFPDPSQLPDDQQLVQFLADQYGIYPDDEKNQVALVEAAAKIRAGEQFVRLAYRKVIHDRPALWDRDPVQVIAPPRTTDHGNAEWIVIQHVLSLRRIQQLEADGFFIKGCVAEIMKTLRDAEAARRGEKKPPFESEIEPVTSRSLYAEQSLENLRDKIWGVENDDNILIWEVFHFYDHNNDGLQERCVTHVHPRSITKCRAVPYSAPFPEWPLVKLDFEKVSRRWHSPRGISALLQDLQLETNAQHNARIDGMTLRNAPVWQVPVLSGFRTRNLQFRPGTVVEVSGGATLQPLVQDRGAFPELVSEENMLRTISENYIGIFDAAITSPLSNTRARTATEVSAVVQYTAATSTLDAILFQLGMRKIYTLIWALYMDLGPQEIKLKVAGIDPKSPEAQFMTIKKSEINRKFKLVPTGTVANTNRALELSNARETVAMYVNDQTGFINAHQLRQWHLSLLAQPRWARRILNSPEQAQELLTLRQAAQAIQEDPRIIASMRGRTSPPPPELPRQEIANSGQNGASAQQP